MSYKAGHSVRILNADAIDDCTAKTGAVLPIVGVENGCPIVRDVNLLLLEFYEHELQHIEYIALKSYLSMAHLKQTYEKQRAFISDGFIYTYKGCAHVDDVTVHKYRCEEEQHEIVIFQRAGVVQNIKAYYQIRKNA